MSLTELVHSVTHIVGGTPVQPGRFPFQAGILQDGFQFCGGSLIAPNVVLTAAHCAAVNATDVVLGCEDISDLTQCEVIPVVSNSVFEDYDNDGFLNGDIQLLLLDSDSVQQPIALASPGFDLNAGQDLTVIGWGATNPNTQQTSGGVLLGALLESTTREACDEQYKDLFGNFGSGASSVTPFSGTIVNDFKMCAVGETKDSCQGDSGGPIFMRCDATGEDVQLGIVSFGIGCAFDGIPGVYTTVFHPDGFEFIESFVESQGHSLTTIGSTSEFCVVGGTQPFEELSDPPTPFPSFDLSAWTCSGGYFAAGDGCDCNCGIPDPDCEFEGGSLFNCQAGEICVDAICVSSSTTSAPTGDVPTSTPTSDNGVPPEWSCSESYFGSNDGCDCNCGAPDPDCEPGVSTTTYGCQSGQICVDAVCTNGTVTSSPSIAPTSSPTTSPVSAPTQSPTVSTSFPTSTPSTPTSNPSSSPSSSNAIPPEWSCSESYFGSNDGCDCNCGAPDPDCEPGVSTTIYGCQTGQICVDAVCTNGTVTSSPSIVPTFSPTASPVSAPTKSPTFFSSPPTSTPTTTNAVPPEWFCSPSLFADLLCDCNCGAPDPDCEPGADVTTDMIIGCSQGELCVNATCTNSSDTSSPTFEDVDTGSPTFEHFETTSPTFNGFETDSPTAVDSDFLSLLEELFSSGVGLIAIVVILALLVILAMFCCRCSKKPIADEESVCEKEVDGKELVGGPITEEML